MKYAFILFFAPISAGWHCMWASRDWYMSLAENDKSTLFELVFMVHPISPTKNNRKFLA